MHPDARFQALTKLWGRLKFFIAFILSPSISPFVIEKDGL